ncbi:MarR family winged helix-turn-helix transcriptional regulator [Actinomadura sp. HBU206391]|uniref:MarR family winged helix-turn-helix transcriptional regulator n=1 Tax=Actinomadura sp. HBU206391 TaxID=2731692 RepID=UPI002905DA78|nr:MarR family transcriptional regulator [Actinomadura sp. HBU206391]
MHTPTRGSADPLVTGALDRWDGQGLAGEPWPFMALCSISRLHQLLAKALDAELKRFRIGRTGYFLLTTLALITGGSAQLGALSRLMMVHPTTVKLLIDQLEAEELVTRRPHDHDRRTTLVEITDRGRECVQRANEALTHAETVPLDRLNGLYQDLFAALQPIREAVGDTDL